VTASPAPSSTPGDPGSADAPRILHLDHTSAKGGAEFTLARMLRANPEWESVLLVPPGEGSVFEGLPVVTNGVRQPAGASTGSIGAIAGAAVRLLVQAVATRVHRSFRHTDIVDANSSRSGAYGALATRFSHVAFIVHLHDMVDVEALGPFGFAAMSRLVLPAADGILSCSQATLDTAKPYLRPDALTGVLPSASGLQLGHIRPPRPAGPIRIGMLARIDPWKGQKLLLEAFAAAHPDDDAVLEFAGAPLFGNEAYLDELRTRTAELGLESRVRVLGHVSDVTKLLDEWDIAVQYSTRAEPLGQNVLQYLAAGCAVVVADEGGPAEWVDDDVNGLRVPPRDPAALADALHRLASDPELRGRLSRRGPATPGLMDDAAVTDAHARFYRDLLAQQQPRARRARRAAGAPAPQPDTRRSVR
jgi:glycosyltransferase involved in cell wall biosynthesis